MTSDKGQVPIGDSTAGDKRRPKDYEMVFLIFCIKSKQQWLMLLLVGDGDKSLKLARHFASDSFL